MDPGCDEENGVGSMHLRSRYVERALKKVLDEKGELKYPQRIEKIRQIFVDDCVPTKGWLSFVGKDIKELSIDEMQDLATSKDLRFIPLPNAGLSKRDMLIRTYVAYSDKVLGKTIKHQEANFNYAKLPSIELNARPRIETSKKITNEEIIKREQEAQTTEYGEKDNPKNRFTIEELKAVADSKNIRYDNGVEFADLYRVLFSSI